MLKSTTVTRSLLKKTFVLLAALLLMSLLCAGVVMAQAGSGEANPDEYAPDGTTASCDANDPCAGDPCCGDPCCGDPCCGDPCCDDPTAPGCGEQCYEVCTTQCGDNETCLDEDPYTHWCYLWGNDVCWDDCHVECY